MARHGAALTTIAGARAVTLPCFPDLTEDRPRTTRRQLQFEHSFVLWEPKIDGSHDSQGWRISGERLKPHLLLTALLSSTIRET